MWHHQRLQGLDRLQEGASQVQFIKIGEIEQGNFLNVVQFSQKRSIDPAQSRCYNLGVDLNFQRMGLIYSFVAIHYPLFIHFNFELRICQKTKKCISLFFGFRCISLFFGFRCISLLFGFRCISLLFGFRCISLLFGFRCIHIFCLIIMIVSQKCILKVKFVSIIDPEYLKDKISFLIILLLNFLISQQQQLKMLFSSLNNSLTQNPGIRELAKDKRIQAELNAIRHNQAIHTEIDRRRNFHSFVAEKLQQSKLMGNLEEQMGHHDYLSRIDRLRRQRELMGRDQLLHRLAHAQTPHIPYYESDHVVRSKVEIDKMLPAPPCSMAQLKQTLISPSHLKIQNEKTFTPNYEYKGALAKNILSRWLPPHLQGQDASRKANEKDRAINQRCFTEIQKQMGEIRKRINTRKQRQNINQHSIENIAERIDRKEQNLNNFYSIPIKNQQKKQKHISFVDESSKTDGVDGSYHTKNAKINLSKQTENQEKYYEKPIKNKNKPAKMNKSQIISPKPNKMQAGKNEDDNKQKGSSGMKKIKNRLELSMIVYEDSEHRTINHEKKHLARKYENQCKMRKDVIGKICGSKSVAPRYNLILT